VDIVLGLTEDLVLGLDTVAYRALWKTSMKETGVRPPKKLTYVTYMMLTMTPMPLVMSMIVGSNSNCMVEIL